jgi:hypothetical protein
MSFAGGDVLGKGLEWPGWVTDELDERLAVR